MRFPIRTAILLLAVLSSGTGTENQATGGPHSIFPPRIPPACPNDPETSAAGVLCEDFDTERNGRPGFQWSRLAVGISPNDPLLALGDPGDDVLGYTQGGEEMPTGTAGEQCLGDMVFAQATCSKPVAEENDWHLHSPTEDPGEGYDPTDTPGIGAPDGGKAHSGTRSMHMGRHLDPLSTLGDTMRFRQVAAFVLDPPILLGPESTIEFWHMVEMTEITAFLGINLPTAGGQVHISLLQADGRFEKWQRLAPSFGPYNEHIQEAVSVCEFDPGDDQIVPDDETMCDSGPIWTEVGKITGTDPTCPDYEADCGEVACRPFGPGCTEPGSLGTGVWTRAAFDLSPFAGRTARLRWIATVGGGWSFGTSRSFLEPELDPPVSIINGDSGWYIDDIVLTDLRYGEHGPVEGSGFWKQHCRDSLQELDTLLGRISRVSGAFDECVEIGCSLLDPFRPRRQMRPKAVRELLALWLNIVTGRLPATTAIEVPSLTDAASVGEAIAGIEATICDPESGRSDLEAAKDLAEALSTGSR